MFQEALNWSIIICFIFLFSFAKSAALATFTLPYLIPVNLAVPPRPTQSLFYQVLKTI